MGYVIRIFFFDKRRAVGMGVLDPKVIHGSFLDGFAHCTSNDMPMLLLTYGSSLCALA